MLLEHRAKSWCIHHRERNIGWHLADIVEEDPILASFLLDDLHPGGEWTAAHQRLSKMHAWSFARILIAGILPGLEVSVCHAFLASHTCIFGDRFTTNAYHGRAGSLTTCFTSFMMARRLHTATFFFFVLCIAIILFFGVLYWFDSGNILHPHASERSATFGDCFWLSMQSMSTVGYGVSMYIVYALVMCRVCACP